MEHPSCSGGLEVRSLVPLVGCMWGSFCFCKRPLGASEHRAEPRRSPACRAWLWRVFASLRAWRQQTPRTIRSWRGHEAVGINGWCDSRMLCSRMDGCGFESQYRRVGGGVYGKKGILSTPAGCKVLWTVCRRELTLMVAPGLDREAQHHGQCKCLSVIPIAQGHVPSSYLVPGLGCHSRSDTWS